jgi:hypothetical protein
MTDNDLTDTTVCWLPRPDALEAAADMFERGCEARKRRPGPRASDRLIAARAWCDRGQVLGRLRDGFRPAPP